MRQSSFQMSPPTLIFIGIALCAFGLWIFYTGQKNDITRNLIVGGVAGVAVLAGVLIAQSTKRRSGSPSAPKATREERRSAREARRQRATIGRQPSGEAPPASEAPTAAHVEPVHSTDPGPAPAAAAPAVPPPPTPQAQIRCIRATG